jgi:hypothetical protein
MKEDPVSQRTITRRQVLATGGAASLLLLAPEVLRTAPALALPPAISIGFVDTLAPLAAGARVVAGTQVPNDASLTNRLLSITVGGLYPAADAAFPAASLDAVFPNGSPFYAVSHPGGLATNRASFVQVPGSTGLRFTMRTGSTSLPGGIGPGQTNGLRVGTYVFALVRGTWAGGGTLSGSTAQRSLVVVIRPA